MSLSLSSLLLLSLLLSLSLSDIMTTKGKHFVTGSNEVGAAEVGAGRRVFVLSGAGL